MTQHELGPATESRSEPPTAGTTWIDPDGWTLGEVVKVQDFDLLELAAIGVSDPASASAADATTAVGHMAELCEAGYLRFWPRPGRRDAVSLIADPPRLLVMISPS
jgi:hypothetical protein